MKTLASLPALVLVAYVLVTCAGCGSGGSAGANGLQPQSLQLPTLSPRTAWNNADSDDDVGVPPVVGDTRFNDGIQGFVSFALGAIPAGADLQQATLVLPIVAVRGLPINFGDLFVDAINIDIVGFDYLPQFLEAPDARGTPDLQTLQVRVDVTALVREALSIGRPYADFRLRFAIETIPNGVEDQLGFAEPGAPIQSANRLEISYR